MAVGALFLFTAVTVQWVDLSYVIDAFPHHTRLLFDTDQAQTFVGPDLASNSLQRLSSSQAKGTRCTSFLTRKERSGLSTLGL